MSRFASLTLAAAACLVAVPTFAADKLRVLDSFDASTGWSATGTDDVSAALRVVPGRTSQALCLTYDFNGVSGAASIRKTLPIDYADGFALSFDVRGSMATCAGMTSAPSNTWKIRWRPLNSSLAKA